MGWLNDPRREQIDLLHLLFGGLETFSFLLLDLFASGCRFATLSWWAEWGWRSLCFFNDLWGADWIEKVVHLDHWSHDQLLVIYLTRLRTLRHIDNLNLLCNFNVLFLCWSRLRLRFLRVENTARNFRKLVRVIAGSRLCFADGYVWALSRGQPFVNKLDGRLSCQRHFKFKLVNYLQAEFRSLFRQYVFGRQMQVPSRRCRSSGSICTSRRIRLSGSNAPHQLLWGTKTVWVSLPCSAKRKCGWNDLFQQQSSTMCWCPPLPSTSSCATTEKLNLELPQTR